MSVRIFKNDVLFFQRFLKVSGLYKGPLDGLWSNALDDAHEAFALGYEEIKSESESFDVRSEDCISTLIPTAQRKAHEFLEATKTPPFTYKIISGTRTYAEQNALYAIGRTTDLNKSVITNAKGGQSNHNFGLAWDIGIFDGTKYFAGATKKEAEAYEDLGTHIMSSVAGIEWGGTWVKFVDKPHYQLKVDQTGATLRTSFEDGTAIVRNRTFPTTDCSNLSHAELS
jgi:peptidoglycan LD-endopeptidase CwlK